ncbi:unnamed protein product [Protopolystoma xenopodis]|uniref:Wax synthase domain-containing protein n=1 Tax=Protopolystoma xenopodis TaxID=117903 RepID=A0A448XCS0_9PLAT|nr:unnamed protein product [Protopolystoma xenopodis]
MKMHAFVREKVVAHFNKDHSEVSEAVHLMPYLYFLFAPTLLYRDMYPRLPTCRWRFVVTNLCQGVFCVLFMYFLTAHFLLPFVASSPLATGETVNSIHLLTSITQILGSHVGWQTTLASFAVFLLSGAYHEYIMSLALGFFCPIQLIGIGLCGLPGILLTKRYVNSTVYELLTLASVSHFVLTYTLEWYAHRLRGPIFGDWRDFWLPYTLFS